MLLNGSIALHRAVSAISLMLGNRFFNNVFNLLKSLSTALASSANS